MPYQRETYYEPSRIDAGGAAVFGTLADKLSEFSQRTKQVADAIATPQAERAGMEAAQAGSTKLKVAWNAQNRAYNDALVRSYALNTYADMNQKVSEFEVKAGTDLNQFRADVDGYRKGTLPALMPEARPIIEQALEQRVSEGTIRIGNLAAKEQRAEMMAGSDRGRQVMLDRMSRLYTSGDPNQIAQAEGLNSLYVNSIQGDVAAGLLTQREANAKIDLFHKDVTRQVVTGQLEAELDKPGGDPIKVIEDTLKSASPVLNDAEKMDLVTGLYARLNARQALQIERVQNDTLSMKAQYAAGEKQATELLLQGKLSIGTLERMVSDDRLDPTVARTMRTALKEGNSGIDDERTAALVGLNLLDYEESDILSNPSLSWETRGKLIAKRRELQDSWRTTQAGKEGADRIDRALGLVPGTAVVMLSDAQKRARGAALTEWYDRVDALPDSERTKAAILDLSEQTIDKVITRNNEIQAERIEASRENFIKSHPARESMDKEDQAEFDKTLAGYDKLIQDALKAPPVRAHR